MSVRIIVAANLDRRRFHTISRLLDVPGRGGPPRSHAWRPSETRSTFSSWPFLSPFTNIEQTMGCSYDLPRKSATTATVSISFDENVERPDFLTRIHVSASNEMLVHRHEVATKDHAARRQVGAVIAKVID